jgi:hypothetical protein
MGGYEPHPPPSSPFPWGRGRTKVFYLLPLEEEEDKGFLFPPPPLEGEDKGGGGLIKKLSFKINQRSKEGAPILFGQ